MKKTSEDHGGGFNGLNPCGAHARSTGQPCKQPSMPNGRCRLHGGKSTGRPITTGEWTRQAIQQRKDVSQMSRDMKELIETL